MQEMSKRGRSKVQRENLKWLIIVFFFNLEIKRRKFGNLEEKEHFNNKK